jgi:lysine biosynthesis protein LysW
MQFAKCPSCGSDINVGSQSRMGQMFTCPACGEVSEIVWLDPVELDWPLDDDFAGDDEDETDELLEEPGEWNDEGYSEDE